MPDELHELRLIVARLTQRVYRLEQAAGVSEAIDAVPPAAPATPAPYAPTEPVAVQPVHPQPPPFADANLESRIGSHWLNRIGIVAVLTGVSLFLKFAFDNNWIGPAGRVSIGLIAGAAVVIWSERFRARGYKAFAYSLKAVGIGTLYLSLWAAFQMYHLIPGEAAFAAMAFVTAFAAALALMEDAQILAAVAIAGGFATPLLLSTGENHEAVLFTYVALLDVATLALVAFRPWMRLLAGSFAGTVILDVGWYGSFYERQFLGLTISFATVLFMIFALAPLFAMRETTRDVAGKSPTILLLPLGNAAAYFLAVYTMLESESPAATAWFAVGLAAIYLLLSWEIKKMGGDMETRTLTLVHIALAVGFLTVAIPLKLDAHWISVGWLAESAVLMWVAYRPPGKRLLKVLAGGALMLGIARLLVLDNFHTAQLALNARFATYLVAIAALGWAIRVMSGNPSETEKQATAIAAILINVLGVLAISLEVRDYFDRQYQTGWLVWKPRSGLYGYRHVNIIRDFVYSAAWMLYGTGLMLVGFWKRSAFLRWQALVLMAITIGKVFLYDAAQLDRAYRIVSFMALGVLLLAISFVYQRDWLKLSGSRTRQPVNGGGSTRT